jgi:hypothetical protein
MTMKRFFAVLVLGAFLMSVMSVAMAQPGKVNAKPAAVKTAPVSKVVASKTIRPNKTRRAHKNTKVANCKSKAPKTVALKANNVAKPKVGTAAKPKAAVLKATKVAAPKVAGTKPVAPRPKK